MTARYYTVTDIESSGLSPTLHQVVEAGFWNFGTGERMSFIPPHTLENADPEALIVNRYHERDLGNEALWDDGSGLRRLHAALDGNWLVGSNPSFDASFLSPLFLKHGLDPEPWHYSSPFDLGLYGCGVLNRPMGGRFSAARLCAALNVEPGDHSALGDVISEGTCLIELLRIVKSREAA